MGRYRINHRISVYSMQVRNREEYLMEYFPDKEGRTYIQSLDEHLLCEYSGLPSVESYGSDRGICAKCGHLLDREGICWRCLTESNK